MVRSRTDYITGTDRRLFLNVSVRDPRHNTDHYLVLACLPGAGTVPIRFGTYNIRNGRRGGLELELRGMSQANMDLGILQETKITNGIYTRGSAGYTVIATDAPS